MPSNPTPRAALTSAEGAVARPALRRRAGATPVPPVPPPPSPTDVIFGPAGGRAVPVPVPVPVETGHKVKSKKGRKHEHAKAPVETVEVVVPLTKPVRRALKAAAAERETTPEELAALVLSAWLER